MPDLRALFSCSSLLLLALGVASCPAHSQTIVIVRHAERAGGTAPDVELSESGKCRSEALARMLTDANVKTVFTSEVRRTQQTAAPLVKAHDIPAVVLPAKEIDTLVTRLRSLPAGDTALVVGHSNTVPEIVSRLGAGSIPSIADDEYDRFLVVNLTPANHATLLALRYPGCALSGK